ncbi:hypothetical protein GGR56DRAFT_87755 [Xylariaceae sp. FL0804]|nr:hypothetical protein GGR56DRAFT_87755 [Xylariaceae sp. FL0804]
MFLGAEDFFFYSSSRCQARCSVKRLHMGRCPRAKTTLRYLSRRPATVCRAATDLTLPAFWVSFAVNCGTARFWLGNGATGTVDPVSLGILGPLRWGKTLGLSHPATRSPSPFAVSPWASSLGFLSDTASEVWAAIAPSEPPLGSFAGNPPSELCPLCRIGVGVGQHEASRKSQDANIPNSRDPCRMSRRSDDRLLHIHPSTCRSSPAPTFRRHIILHKARRARSCEDPCDFVSHSRHFDHKRP